MDIHRCRFVPYKPSAVNAVAFSHPKTKSAKQGSVARLAVGRANGDIEIWNPSSGAWHQELVIRGGRDRSIDGLVWVNEPDQDLGDGKIAVGKSRLFSIGYTSTVTEWDLEKGKPKRHASGQHGDIWCLAVQPPALSGATDDLHSNKLIAGTIDGELAMYSIEDDDLRFQRVVVRSPAKKAQMVSITFQSRKIAVVGCSDSTIRIYDVTKGHMLRHMTLGADLAGGAKISLCGRSSACPTVILCRPTQQAKSASGMAGPTLNLRDCRATNRMSSVSRSALMDRQLSAVEWTAVPFSTSRLPDQATVGPRFGDEDITTTMSRP